MTISFYINGRMYVVPISRLVFVKTCKIRMFRRQKCTKENRILSHIYHYVYHQDTYTTQFISLVFSQLWMYVLSSRCLRAQSQIEFSIVSKFDATISMSQHAVFHVNPVLLYMNAVEKTYVYILNSHGWILRMRIYLHRTEQKTSQLPR